MDSNNPSDLFYAIRGICFKHATLIIVVMYDVILLCRYHPPLLIIHNCLLYIWCIMINVKGYIK